ncbi:methyl-accepting chemotaxis protein [Kineobactrum salinum]|uniref:HAMP domain-containing protein n=1 Tax=Kineobactrum salinum TaxID=2708301 RepID=A0A6C0U2T6_9GAMM|nr:methyl-accepting chemotaxis protein [Kineobactrum salinum]QIB64675.1 HAMP domain-containing protein [Kineobactrum salinum]
MPRVLHKIRVKYAIAFISVALALLAIVVVDALLVNTVKQRMTEFSSTFNPASSAILNADRDLYQARVAELEYVQAAPGSVRAEQLRALFAEDAGQALERMQAFISMLAQYPDITAELAGFEELFSSWQNQSRQVFELRDAGDQAAAEAQLTAGSLAAFDALREIYNLAGELADAKVIELEAVTLERVRLQQIAVSAFAVLVFVIATAIALMGPHMMSRAIEQVTGRIREISEGDGDLTVRIDSSRKDEIGDLATQFNGFIARMDHTLLAVRSSTRSVHHAADEIARSSQELASRTEQTSANLQETSASMEEITATVGNTSDAAQQADQLAKSTVTVAHEGQQSMRDVETTMSTISESATQINEIVTLIDGIAFQTNILALNASVEAARAGEHGRGFAVVAQEVRTLASRSSDASRDIRRLVENSVASTQAGSELVRKAGSTMQNIVDSIEQVTRMIGEISSGAMEQSHGISQVNTAVNELDSMTQHNAAMVEQSSAAADGMRTQAEQLQALIAAFRLSRREEGAAASTPARRTPANKVAPVGTDKSRRRAA